MKGPAFKIGTNRNYSTGTHPLAILAVFLPYTLHPNPSTLNMLGSRVEGLGLTIDANRGQPTGTYPMSTPLVFLPYTLFPKPSTLFC